MLTQSTIDTIKAALKVARYSAEHEDIYGYPEKVAAIDLAIAELQADAGGGVAVPEQRWPDDRILAELRERVKGRRSVRNGAIQLLRQMRDEYEAALDNYQAVYLYYIEQADQQARPQPPQEPTR